MVPGRPYKRASVDCRDYTHTVYIEGKPRTMRGTSAHLERAVGSPFGAPKSRSIPWMFWERPASRRMALGGTGRDPAIDLVL